MKNIRKDLTKCLKEGKETTCSICLQETVDDPNSESITYLNCGKNTSNIIGHFYHTCCFTDYAKVLFIFLIFIIYNFIVIRT